MNNQHFKSLSRGLVLGTLLAVAGNAQAGHKDRDYRSGDRANSERVWAEVIESRPIYREIRVSTPRRECWEERVTYIEQRGRDHSGSTIIGGVIGGVLGHQIGGSRRHRDAATVAGSLIGMAIGNDHSRKAHPPSTVRNHGWEEQCRTTENVRYEERLDGYEVSYRYAGRVYHTRMPYDPGRRMRINVSVRPSVRD